VPQARPPWERRFSRWAFGRPFASAAALGAYAGLVVYVTFRSVIVALAAFLVMFAVLATSNVRRRARLGTLDAWKASAEAKWAREHTPEAVAQRRRRVLKLMIGALAVGMTLGWLLVLSVRHRVLGP